MSVSLQLAGPRSGNGISIDVFVFNGIPKHRRQGRSGPIDLLSQSLAVLKVVHQLDDIRPSDAIRRPISEGRHHMPQETPLRVAPTPMVGAALLFDVLHNQLADRPGRGLGLSAGGSRTLFLRHKIKSALRSRHDVACALASFGQGGGRVGSWHRV
jgi:hypothetical protein